MTEPVTLAQATAWTTDPDSAPPWLSALHGEHLARAAQQEYHRQQQQEQRELKELTAEQTAVARVERGARHFTDAQWLYVADWAFEAAKNLVRDGPDAQRTTFERQVLAAAGINADNHATWPMHAGGCDGEGAAHCSVRIEQRRAQRRVDALLDSVARETVLRERAFSPGQFVTTGSGWS